MIQQSDYNNFTSVIKKINKGDHGYFVFGNESEPYYKNFLVTSDIYEMNGEYFFNVEEKYPVSAHTEDVTTITANGFYITYGKAIIDEYATNRLTLKASRWFIDLEKQLSIGRIGASRNIIFKEKLDAAGYIVYLRSLKSNDNDD